MQRSWRGLVLIVFLTTPFAAGAARAGAFLDCQSAENQGESTGRFFTSASYNRLACDAGGLSVTEETLANVLRVRGELHTSDDDDIKTCYYAGLYRGYAEQTADEYVDCGSTGAFRAVTRASLARMAEAVFVPASRLSIPDRRRFVTAVFGINDDFVAACDRACQVACADLLRTLVARDLPGGDRTLAAELSTTVCDGTP